MKKVSLILALVIFFSAVYSNLAQAQNGKWSPQAKGAVIGGLGGAAAGAIIHKRNRAVGGVVGGVAGAGVGYAIGKRTDNKRKEAARVAAANQAAANRAAEARAERAALARRVAAAEKKADLAAQAQKQQQQYPVVANGFAANTPMMLTAANGPVAAGYLPNESYGDRNKAYSTSEVRRKSW
ncbi:YMGG-like glycine zipper-containing protein [Hymenobacter cellulosilyticus]|uniref:Glycine zipper domain-containing protein n=1 Tax=Hymenobacter cellulosilyticus TaxID=2932248 RepID=A0A8T9QHH0_9BACT|nr:glycine zipper domain-containing protein [Hymenobacter cellulosilyticus]UOQ74253.1 glycine zipper domain-containing protein [Hymenobacter cellulosilyticus]